MDENDVRAINDAALLGNAACAGVIAMSKALGEVLGHADLAPKIQAIMLAQLDGLTGVDSSRPEKIIRTMFGLPG